MKSCLNIALGVTVAKVGSVHIDPFVFGVAVGYRL